MCSRTALKLVVWYLVDDMIYWLRVLVIIELISIELGIGIDMKMKGFYLNNVVFYVFCADFVFAT